METLDSLVRRNAQTSRQRYDSATAEMIGRLEKAHRLTPGGLQAVTYAQACGVWWDMVLIQTDQYNLDIDEALQVVRAWATRYLQAEAAQRPACVQVISTVPAGPDASTALFERALDVTGRVAARRFLSATSGTDPTQQP